MGRIMDGIVRARLTERARYALRVGLGAAVVLGEEATRWGTALAAKGEAVEPAVLGPVVARVGRLGDAVTATAARARAYAAGGARRVARGLDLASSGDMGALGDRLDALARALDGKAEAAR